MTTQDTSNQSSSPTKHPRRSFLGFATAAVAGWMALLQPSHAKSAALAAEIKVAPEIEGTWIETVTLHGDGLPDEMKIPFPTLITFARGGGLVTIAGNTAPTRGNLSQGTWAKTGPKQFAFTFIGFFYDAQGVLENYVKAQETLQFGSDRTAYDGVATIQLLDLNFEVLGQVDATTHAVRVDAK